MEGRPNLAAGDVVYLRLAACAQDGREYAGQVVFTDQTTCLLAMPPRWWYDVSAVRAASLSSTAAEGSAVDPGAVAGAAGACVDPAAPLVHVCFTFDRTHLHRMHCGLWWAAAGVDGTLDPATSAAAAADTRTRWLPPGMPLPPPPPPALAAAATDAAVPTYAAAAYYDECRWQDGQAGGADGYRMTQDPLDGPPAGTPAITYHGKRWAVVLGTTLAQGSVPQVRARARVGAGTVPGDAGPHGQPGQAATGRQAATVPVEVMGRHLRCFLMCHPLPACWPHPGLR